MANIVFETSSTRVVVAPEEKETDISPSFNEYLYPKEIYKPCNG